MILRSHRNGVPRIPKFRSCKRGTTYPNVSRTNPLAHHVSHCCNVARSGSSESARGRPRGSPRERNAPRPGFAIAQGERAPVLDHVMFTWLLPIVCTARTLPSTSNNDGLCDKPSRRARTRQNWIFFARAGRTSVALSRTGRPAGSPCPRVLAGGGLRSHRG